MPGSQFGERTRDKAFPSAENSLSILFDPEELGEKVAHPQPDQDMVEIVKRGEAGWLWSSQVEKAKSLSEN